MIKIVSYLFLFFTISGHALVPVEGILMGDASSEIQTDPLASIFSSLYDTTKKAENNKVKLYQATFESGQNLAESCTYLGAPIYSSSWHEKQARRNMAATLQYIGLDTSIKAIGAYAKKMDVSESDYKLLTKNLISNYCSKNMTIFSLRNVKSSLLHYYQNPLNQMVPSLETSPFAPEVLKASTEKPIARSREFDLVIKNFRAFCSWGGEVEDYRLLGEYLKNKFIMAFVIKNMMGVQDLVDERKQKVISAKSSDTVQVLCNDLICRKENVQAFTEHFPLSLGSTGIATDLSKIYCHHFRFQDTQLKTIPEVKAWIKAQELEDPILETSQFISLMTGVPDFFNGVDKYNDLPLVIRSSIDERWNKWARLVLSTFSMDLLYEESLRIKLETLTDPGLLASKGFKIDFTVTLGELDRLLNDTDKLRVSFNLKLSKNYLRSIRTKWRLLEREVDTDGQKQFKADIASYLDLQLREKQKHFTQKMWNEDLSRLIAEELVQQVIRYRGSLFDSYQDKVFDVPVRFSYGLFALSYLRYRADVAAGRLKIEL